MPKIKDADHFIKNCIRALATKMYYKLQSQAQIIRHKVEIKIENQPSPCA